APRAHKALGPTQLRQCGDARRLIPIAIHEREKPGHRRPPAATSRPAQDIRSTRTYQEQTNPACANRIGRLHGVAWSSASGTWTDGKVSLLDQRRPMLKSS